MARIVRGDIPVSNGVVHLISRPLAITATSMLDYLDARSNANQLGKFSHWLEKRGGGLRRLIASTRSGTVFAPSNSAFTPEAERVLDEDPERAEQGRIS